MQNLKTQGAAKRLDYCDSEIKAWNHKPASFDQKDCEKKRNLDRIH